LDVRTRSEFPRYQTYQCSLPRVCRRESFSKEQLRVCWVRSVRWRETIFYVHLFVAVVFGVVGLKRWYRDQHDFLTYNPFGLLLAVNALPAAVSLLWFGLYHINNLRTSQTTKVRVRVVLRVCVRGVEPSAAAHLGSPAPMFRI